jgi:hypothetical protein
MPHSVRWIEADPFGDCSCSWHGAVSVYPEAGLPGWWLSGTRAGFERAWYKLIRLHPVGQGQHVVALLVSDRSPAPERERLPSLPALGRIRPLR